MKPNRVWLAFALAMCFGKVALASDCAKRNNDDVDGAQADTAAALEIDSEIAGTVRAKGVLVAKATGALGPSQSVRPCQTVPSGTSAMAEITSYGTFDIAQTAS